MHNPAYQFQSLAQQQATAKHGMWLLLISDAVLFGGLFIVYASWRATRPEIFAYGCQRMDGWAGGVSTLLLVSSSLTMALAVRVSHGRQSRYSAVLLLMTFCLGLEFLAVKTYEASCQFQYQRTWGAQFYQRPTWLVGGVIPNPSASTVPTTVATLSELTAIPLHHQLRGTALPAAATAARGLATPVNSDSRGASLANSLHHSLDPARPAGAHLFFALYHLTNWILAIHLLLGLGVLLWIMLRAARREFGPKFSIPVQLCGMYWHLLSVTAAIFFALYYVV